MSLPFVPLLLKLAPWIAKNATAWVLQAAPKNNEIIAYLQKHAPEAVPGLIQPLAKVNPLEQAIQATCELASSPPDLESTLRAWIQAESFQALLASLLSGALPPNETALEDVAATLHPFLCILDPERTQAAALRTIEIFLRSLDRFVVFGAEGIATHDLRDQERHEITRNVVRSEFERFRSSPTPVVENTGPLPEAEWKFTARLDTVRTLLRSGHIRAARATLADIERELDSATASPQIQYRLEANLGVCALFLEDSDQVAAKHFEQARKHQPEHPTGYANSARAFPQ